MCNHGTQSSLASLSEASAPSPPSSGSEESASPRPLVLIRVTLPGCMDSINYKFDQVTRIERKGHASTLIDLPHPLLTGVMATSCSPVELRDQAFDHPGLKFGFLT